MPDPYTATWVSYSSITDWQNCPRAYYLKNVYKNPDTGNKIQIASPALALGQIVHEVIESLSTIPTEKRFQVSLVKKYEEAWKKVSGKRGGFFDAATEQQFKNRGEAMLRKVMQNPGPVGELAVKIKAEKNLPRYWLSEEDNIILNGKIDWLQYLKEQDAVRIIDFKTGRKKENSDSLQLPIYLLLVTHTQKWPVIGMSYWYLELENAPETVTLPDLQESQQKILKVAKEIALARKLNRFRCPQGENGCMHCRPFEKILNNQAEFVGEDREFRRDIYAFPMIPTAGDETGSIL